MYAMIVRAVGVSICAASTFGIAGLAGDAFPEPDEPPVALASGVDHEAAGGEPAGPVDFLAAPAAADRASAVASGHEQRSGGGYETIHRVYRVTAYCDRGQTASGVPSGVGQCAAPAHIPFGSRIHIPSLGRTFVVTDRTHRRFRHNTVDIFIPQKERCWKFGRRYLTCQVTLAKPRAK